MRRANAEAGLDKFIARVDATPRLSRAEEGRLIRLYQSKRDPTVAEKIISAHYRNVLMEAFQFQGYGIAVLELVSEGCLGMMHALDKFECLRGRVHRVLISQPEREVLERRNGSSPVSEFIEQFYKAVKC